jgi:hypothetical protein
MRLLAMITSALLLTACGGGGGGGGSSSGGSTPAPTTTYCINSQVTGCSYSATDPTQTAYGWWQGTSYVGSNVRPAYFAANSLGGFQMYLGNDFSGGFFAGSSATQGSVLTLSSTMGVDPLSTYTYSAYLSGSDGGVITNKILSYTQPSYNLAKASMTMSYTYNTFGDQPLSAFVGNYVSGASSLTIASNGQISATYPAPIYIPYNQTQMCTLTTSVATSTLMKNVVISGTDDCGRTPSMGLYYFTLTGVNHMVLRLSVANNTSQKAIVF